MMVMPTTEDLIPHCPKCGWTNNIIRPALSGCCIPPFLLKPCPKCGGKTCFRPLTRVEKWKYRWGILKGFG
ncbi:hypothetical protein ABWE88_08045 [Pasteurella multocida]|uniref:hypothetical protein n=1 Tax=Pasteurella multocida TaxID=747 RepID=UPI00202369E3|nr:hypothetical protein [Pasteurella multocida]MDY0578394.1 hypothetical protein [Pasteurella multocida]MEB3479574.1 hypothetical protein [Pasteurella multocida]MEB3497013.1 hypothetical protein [Pasteurella multocida]MEB3500441.1 hypothetical protein [Pasteurella multocida]URH80031.1 hypothetical protein M8846_09365 [Pasteurella multocida]